LQREALPGFYLGDAVRTGADGNSERLVLEMFGVGVGGRKHRHQREGQRQFTIVGAGEIEAHGIGVRRLHRTDLGIGRALLRAAFFAQQAEGEHDVGGGDRRSVGEARAGIEAKDDASRAASVSMRRAMRP